MPAIIEPQGPPAAGDPPPALAARLAWFFALAFGGVAGVGLVAYGLRWLMRLG